ncbi:MAG: exodeoxyribonuclease VII large subunit [Thermus sp.]|uniref:exodeoxyribonuclease VII large subunit n=1 Tax=Thermus sp. TaxID=275 RepID=UPI0026BA1168
MKPNGSPQNPSPVTPDQLLKNLQSLLTREVFRRLREEGPYLVQGTFANHSQKAWGNFYYGDFKGGSTSIRLKVPLGITLREGRSYVLSVTPELAPSNKGLPFVFQVEAIHEEAEASPTPEVRLPQRSREKVDVRGFLMGLLRKGETPALALVLGENAIVHKDVEVSMGSARDRYRVDQRRVSLANPGAVAEALAQVAEGPYHLVALIRGGGDPEDLKPLDGPEVWNAVASCPKPIVVALGHAADTLWVEALADEAFPTPTALGHFLKEVVEAVEREREAAKLSDLLERAQEEAKAARTERDLLKERIRRLEQEPARLVQEMDRLRRGLALWRGVALFLLAAAILLLLARG